MYTVIVADDEEEIRRALVKRVNWEGIGFKLVGEASNGAEALEMVEKFEPDLLLTDIKMPFISGIELARQVREVRPSTQIAFLSGYDDFEYAQMAIQYNIISYILKPISADEITNELIIIRSKIDDKFTQFKLSVKAKEDLDKITFLVPLILDGYANNSFHISTEGIRSEAEMLGLASTEAAFDYCIMVTSLVDREGHNATEKSAVNSVDIILDKYIKHVSFYSEGRVISFLYGTRRSFDKYLHIIVDDISQSVNRIMSCNCCIGVSRLGDSLLSLHELYVESMNAISYSSSAGNSIRFITDVESTFIDDIEEFESFVADEERYIRNGLVMEAEDLAKRLFASMDTVSKYKLSANFIVPNLTAAVYRILYSVVDKESIDKLQEECPLQMTDLSGDKNKIGSYCIRLCKGAASLVSEKCKQTSSQHSELAIEIIDKEFSDPDLSLVTVAQQINVSPNYLSALIRKVTGNTFIEILTKRRMDEATKLLYYPALKVKDVAVKCGYEDQHYFSYSFKKATGMSPIQFRKQIPGFVEES